MGIVGNNLNKGADALVRKDGKFAGKGELIAGVSVIGVLVLAAWVASRAAGAEAVDDDTVLDLIDTDITNLSTSVDEYASELNISVNADALATIGADQNVEVISTEHASEHVADIESADEAANKDVCDLFENKNPVSVEIETDCNAGAIEMFKQLAGELKRASLDETHLFYGLTQAADRGDSEMVSKIAHELAIKFDFWKPGSAEESALLFEHTKFVMFDNGTFNALAPDGKTVIASYDCDGNIMKYNGEWMTSGPCEPCEKTDSCEIFTEEIKTIEPVQEKAVSKPVNTIPEPVPVKEPASLCPEDVCTIPTTSGEMYPLTNGNTENHIYKALERGNGIALKDIEMGSGSSQKMLFVDDRASEAQIREIAIRYMAQGAYSPKPQEHNLYELIVQPVRVQGGGQLAAHQPWCLTFEDTRPTDGRLTPGETMHVGKVRFSFQPREGGTYTAVVDDALSKAGETKRGDVYIANLREYTGYLSNAKLK